MRKSLEDQHRAVTTLNCVCGERKPKGCLEKTSVIPKNCRVRSRSKVSLRKV